MEILDFQRVVEARFSELGDPRDDKGCCPLGLVCGDPNDMRPEPEKVSEKTGLPFDYCVGLAEGWDDRVGCNHHRVAPNFEFWPYVRGYADGKRARKRWLSSAT